MNDRVSRLQDKAEAAADRGDLEQAETYRILASQAAYFARKEAQALERMLQHVTDKGD
ncbi:hypothetical protein [Microbacterium sp. ProA8]|uniref:hypothetical protein n=1 Tax=Microbacterium chionoecetis TaxID=3153754 RepID=UPI0032671A2E